MDKLLIHKFSKFNISYLKKTEITHKNIFLNNYFKSSIDNNIKHKYTDYIPKGYKNTFLINKIDFNKSNFKINNIINK